MSKVYCARGFEREYGLSPCALPLSMACEGEVVRVVGIRGGCGMQERLLSMGIALDDEINVLQRQGKGAVLIGRNGTKYALGGGMAQKIQVIRCK
ncbi:FeoA family protein [Desulfogranum japonicum]|uniref:FeoA family protein n=1 Tax=Desulfogranum japonicum TaxID=231447 RepID=UPI000688FA27|nr:FeoA family protein [Desulfogranum japonicum]